ncbi:MAG TPA: 4a-hydroxytetrahydrobiopterin dehydratase [Nitrolancea sp.]
MARLSDAELSSALKSLDGWASAGGEISKTFAFKDFVASVGFVNRLADLAEKAQHHPDIDIRFNKVKIALTTHDEGGISDKDTALASQIDSVA